MAVKPLVIFPDPALSIPCAVVSHFDAHLRQLVQDLWDTLYASPGVGLAAPQIGQSQRVSVIDVSLRKMKSGKAATHHGKITLINPILLMGEGEQIPREGCLSVPEILANVHRYQTVTVDYQDEKGHHHMIQTDGFEALALQHEIDHLNGELFLDRVTNIKTDIFRRK